MAFSAIATVSSHGTTVLTESFTYANGAIVGALGSPWANHSGTASQANVAAGALSLTFSESEDINAPLTGQPYTSGKMTSTFDVTFTALPNLAGTYFAHYKDSANGFRSRLYASITGAASGSFRLGISNSNNSLANTVFVSSDLSLNTLYSITTTWDLDTLVSTLEITGVNSGAAVSATDSTNNTAISVTSFAFRQATGIGTMTVDNLLVTHIPEPSAALLGGLGFLALLRRRR